MWGISPLFCAKNQGANLIEDLITFAKEQKFSCFDLYVNELGKKDKGRNRRNAVEIEIEKIKRY